MTIAKVASGYEPAVYTANGSQTVFGFTFPVFRAEHLVVSINGVSPPPIGYVVHGVGNEEGGNIAFSAPPLDGSEIQIERQTPIQRDTSYENDKAFSARPVDAEFATLFMIAQELSVTGGGDGDGGGQGPLPIVTALDVGMTGDPVLDVVRLNQAIETHSAAGGARFMLRASALWEGQRFRFDAMVRNRSNCHLEFMSPVDCGKLGRIRNAGTMAEAPLGEEFGEPLPRLTSDVSAGATELPLTIPTGWATVSQIFSAGDSVIIRGKSDGGGSAIDVHESIVTVVGASSITIADPMPFAALAVYPPGDYEEVFGTPDRTFVTKKALARGAADFEAGSTELEVTSTVGFAAGDYVIVTDDEVAGDTAGTSTVRVNSVVRRVVEVLAGPARVRVDWPLSGGMTVANGCRIEKLLPCENATVRGAVVRHIEAPDAAPASRTSPLENRLAVRSWFIDCSVPGIGDGGQVGTRGQGVRTERSYLSGSIRCYVGATDLVDDGDGYGFSSYYSSLCGHIDGGYGFSSYYSSLCGHIDGHAERRRHGFVVVAGDATTLVRPQAVDCLINGVDFHGCGDRAGMVLDPEILGGSTPHPTSVTKTGIKVGNTSHLKGSFGVMVRGGRIAGYIGTGTRALQAHPPSGDFLVDSTLIEDCSEGLRLTDLDGFPAVSGGAIELDGVTFRRILGRPIQINGNFTGATDPIFDRVTLTDCREVACEGRARVRQVAVLSMIRWTIEDPEPNTDHSYAVHVQDVAAAEVRSCRMQGTDRGIFFEGCDGHVAADNILGPFTHATQAWHLRASDSDGQWLGNVYVAGSPELFVETSTIDRRDLWTVTATGGSGGTRFAPLPAGYVAGFHTEHDGDDADHDIVVHPGAARSTDDEGNIIVHTALTKQIDASWAVGDDAGALDTGSVEADKWYAQHAIAESEANPEGDVLLSLSADTPTLPDGYLLFRRTRWHRTDSSANLVPVVQYPGGEFRYVTSPALDLDSSSIGTDPSLHTISAPPNTEAIINVRANDNNNSDILLSPTSVAAQEPSSTASPLASIRVSSTSGATAGPHRIRVDENSQIRIEATEGIQAVRIAPLGWTDTAALGADLVPQWPPQELATGGGGGNAFDAFGLFENLGDFDEEDEGFVYYSTDGDGITSLGVLFVKLSNSSGDWSSSIPFQGPEGPPGDGGGGGHVIQENGTPLASRAALNFGAGLVASDNDGDSRTDVAADVGTSIGQLVQLVDAGGSTPGLPAVSGALLTGLPGGGDMVAAVYDPNAIAGDAFDMDNMVEGADAKILTASERAAIASALQPADIAAGDISPATGDADFSGGLPGDVLTRDETGFSFMSPGATELADIVDAGGLAALDELPISLIEADAGAPQTVVTLDDSGVVAARTVAASLDIDATGEPTVADGGVENVHIADGTIRPVKMDLSEAGDEIDTPGVDARVLVRTSGGAYGWTEVQDLPTTGGEGSGPVTEIDDDAVHLPEAARYLYTDAGGTIVVLGSAFDDNGIGQAIKGSGAGDIEIFPANDFSINGSDQTGTPTTVSDLVLQNAATAEGEFASTGGNLPAASSGQVWRLTEHDTGNALYRVDTVDTPTELWSVTRLDGSNFANASSESADVGLVAPLLLISRSTVERIGADFTIPYGTSAPKSFDGSNLTDIDNVAVSGAVSGNGLAVIARGSGTDQPTVADSGAYITSDGAITIPNAAVGDGWFHCTLEFGGDHNVTFNSVTLDISEFGDGYGADDVVSVVVKSATTIRIIGAQGVADQTDFSA